MNKNKKSKLLYGFTLVELIIVITILAILATIAFISFQNYTKDAQESKKIATVKNIQTGLDLYQIKSGKYPIPDGQISTGSIQGALLTYMGIIGKDISQKIQLNTFSQKNTSQNGDYVYGITADQQEYQIGYISDATVAHNFFFPTTIASTFFARVIGTYKGYIEYKNPIDNNKIYIANIPSLLYTFSDSNNELTSTTGVYFSIDKGNNLPYIGGAQIDTIARVIQQKTKSSSGGLVNKEKEELFNNPTPEDLEKFGVSSASDLRKILSNSKGVQGHNSDDSQDTNGGATGTGEIYYDTPGTYMFTIPNGVTSISAVCVGAGGGGGLQVGAGGGGGGLVYLNDFPVTSGAQLTIKIGEGGKFTTGAGTAGGNSEIIELGMIAGGGGGGGSSTSHVSGGVGGVFSGGTGFRGGDGGSGNGSFGSGGGGGGAAGFEGIGGKGSNGSANDATSQTGVLASNSGGAGGAKGNPYDSPAAPGGGGGGGVDLLYPKSGMSHAIAFKGGIGGTSLHSPTYDGETAVMGVGRAGNGGKNGGGGGGGYKYSAANYNAGNGGNGACRILWPGLTRNFPFLDTNSN